MKTLGCLQNKQTLYIRPRSVIHRGKCLPCSQLSERQPLSTKNNVSKDNVSVCLCVCTVHPYVFVCDNNWMYVNKAAWLMFPHEQMAQGKL